MINWIPVGEQLPKKEGVYLCTAIFNGERYVFTCWYSNKIHEDWDDPKLLFPNGYAFGEMVGYDGEDGPFKLENIYEVVAWCCLPEPYKK